MAKESSAETWRYAAPGTGGGRDPDVREAFEGDCEGADPVKLAALRMVRRLIECYSSARRPD